MRRVLVLNYFFPPLGGAAALRGVTLARRLPQLGFEPVVVTGPGQSFGRFRPNDETLAVPGVEVHRIPGVEPARPGGWAARRDRWLARPGAWEDWLEEGLVATGREVRDIDLVYADLGPDATARAASRLAAELGRPWIADLGDPWALDEMRVYQSALHRRADTRAMRRALGTAAGVVMNTREAAAALQRAFPEMRTKAVAALPVGFDAEDFSGPEEERSDGTFRIVHTGSFHTSMARAHQQSARLRRLLRGGPHQPVDVLPRTPVFLGEALRRLAATEPALAGRIEVHLAGSLTEADREALAGVAGVRELGFLSHPETIALIRSADLLFLPMQDLAPGGRARMVPCKAYEYLASGRPILAAMPPGDGRDLMARTDLAFVVEPADTDAMVRVVGDEARRRERRPSVASQRAEAIGTLERGDLNGQLVQLFDTVLARAAEAPNRPDTVKRRSQAAAGVKG
jgi:glycosyltransferase involved in cell wall biosynthesis